MWYASCLKHRWSTRSSKKPSASWKRASKRASRPPTLTPKRSRRQRARNCSRSKASTRTAPASTSPRCVPTPILGDAQVDDCDALSALAFASKASWGYDDTFMEACRADLTILPENLRNARVRIADRESMVGFHGVVGDELEWLFV